MSDTVQVQCEQTECGLTLTLPDGFAAQHGLTFGETQRIVETRVALRNYASQITMEVEALSVAPIRLFGRKHRL